MQFASHRFQKCCAPAALIITLWACSSVEAGSEFDQRLRRVVQSSPIALNNVTWCILDSEGAPLSEHKANQPMKPASTMKLLTTAAAFEHLPALFQTKIWAQQTDEGAVLRWVGVGDPMMGDPGPLDDSRIPSTLLSQLATEIRRAESLMWFDWNTTRGTPRPSIPPQLARGAIFEVVPMRISRPQFLWKLGPDGTAPQFDQAKP